jgi:hypothetical protein
MSGQEYFEGVLEYKVSYESSSESIPTELLENEFGTSFTAYVQEDRYAMIYHSTGQFGWMKVIVSLKDGYSYTEFENSDTIAKSRLNMGQEELIEFKRNSDNKKMVLAELCESVTIVIKPLAPDAFYQEQRGTHYFNPKYKLNAKLYEKYTDGFWNLFVVESNAISIRNETEFYPLFKKIDEATSIVAEAVPDAIFKLDPNKTILE